MTRTEERLADALDAAARALREDTLRPLLVPERPRHRSALAAPLAAAAALLLVVGLGVAAAHYLPGSGQPAAANARPSYYVEANFSGDLPQVRSTATGRVTDTVSVPHVRNSLIPSVVAAASNGVFFAAVAQSAGERVFRFRVTARGRISDLAAVRDGVFGKSGWGVGAMAASPDGSQLAVALAPTCSFSAPCSYTNPTQNGYIDVLNTTTGVRSVWQGGTGHSFSFSVVSLSWTSDGNELVYYGQWCPQAGGNSFIGACLPGTPTGGAKAQVWALSPRSRGGTLTSGRRLFQVPAALSDVPQAEISPDGSTIAAAVASPARAGANPTELAVEQFSVSTGKRLRVLYRQDLRRAFGKAKSGGYIGFVGLSSDSTGQYWTLSDTVCTITACSSGVNGWIDKGQLVPLQPDGGSVSSEAW